MKRKWLKIAGWIILTPVSLFLLLMILLYIPPVQDFIRRKATSMVSEATGLDISVRRIDLRFPLNLLVRDAQVIQPAQADTIHADTLLVLGSLNVRIQAWPLLRGQVEVDEVSIEDVSVNTADMLPDMHRITTMPSTRRPRPSSSVPGSASITAMRPSLYSRYAVPAPLISLCLMSIRLVGLWREPGPRPSACALVGSAPAKELIFIGISVVRFSRRLAEMSTP